MITELSKDKFEITVNADQIIKHVVSVTDQMLLNLTKNKISKSQSPIFAIYNYNVTHESGMWKRDKEKLKVCASLKPKVSDLANDAKSSVLSVTL